MTIEAKLDILENQLKNVIELLQISITSLNTKKSVSKFLNKSEKTIDNYIKNNIYSIRKYTYKNSWNTNGLYIALGVFVYWEKIV